MNRIKYYDLLRIISSFLVVFYHMLIQLHLDGLCPVESVNGWYENANMHIATLAVSLFFMLSGAGLTLSAGKGIELKAYYKGRFLRLLVPFYVVNLAFYALVLVKTGHLPGVFSMGIPAWRYIFTLIGLDGWVLIHGLPTFYNSIGEWFLGALIILTVLFPLLWYCMNRQPVLFFAACTGAYIWLLYRGTSTVPVHMHLAFKGYEFVLGMYFARYCKRFPAAVVAIAAAIFLFFAISPIQLRLNEALKILLCGVSAFVAASGMEPLLQKGRKDILRRLQNYSYYLFLVHHLVIFYLTPRFIPHYGGLLSVAVFFLIEALVMVAVTVPIRFFTDWVIGILKRCPLKRAEA